MIKAQLLSYHSTNSIYIENAHAIAILKAYLVFHKKVGIHKILLESLTDPGNKLKQNKG